jgi:hypothetical protein
VGILRRVQRLPNTFVFVDPTFSAFFLFSFFFYFLLGVIVLMPNSTVWLIRQDDKTKAYLEDSHRDPFRSHNFAAGPIYIRDATWSNLIPVLLPATYITSDKLGVRTWTD